MKRIINTILSLVCSLLLSDLSAQSLEKLDQYYEDFVRFAGVEDSTANKNLMLTYQECVSVINSETVDSMAYEHAKMLLRKIHPYLMDAAVFHSQKNAPDVALAFAQSYIDVPFMKAFNSEKFETNSYYPTIVYFAASGTYNSNDYERAIIYLHEYLNTGEEKSRQMVFQYLVHSCICVNNIRLATQILKKALPIYPDDINLLSMAINVCIDTKDNVGLQTHVSKALALSPDDVTLLNIQGNLYESTGNYSGAVDTYTKIREINPTSLGATERMAVNYFNLGLTLNNENENDSIESLNCFRSAASLLEEIIAAKPESLKYLNALATAYERIGIQNKVDVINNKIAAITGENPTEEIPVLLAENIIVPTENIPTDSTQTNYASSGSITADSTLMVSDNNSGSDVAIAENAPSAPVTEEEEGPKKSDVMLNIPVTDIKNSTTFALIIANENYDSESQVTFALNDGRTFKEYCEKTLGIPTKNIRMVEDGTLGKMAAEIDWLKNILSAFGEDANAIVYYSGHGVPNEANGEAYLLPVDCYGSNYRYAYSINEMYETLGNAGGASITYFLDACFSGAQRDGNMMVAARGVAIKAKSGVMAGNSVAFAAASGDETAFPYVEKGHGIFTYFLLKKLQETKGQVSYGDLADYIRTQVRRISLIENPKQQSPNVIHSTSMIDKWQGMSFVK